LFLNRGRYVSGARRYKNKINGTSWCFLFPKNGKKNRNLHRASDGNRSKTFVLAFHFCLTNGGRDRHRSIVRREFDYNGSHLHIFLRCDLFPFFISNLGAELFKMSSEQSEDFVPPWPIWQHTHATEENHTTSSSGWVVDGCTSVIKTRTHRHKQMGKTGTRYILISEYIIQQSPGYY
jgi:hypothetical protein